MTIGKSRAKVCVETDTKVTFRDVVDEAKYELQEVVAFLRDPKSFGRLGARIPKGVGRAADWAARDRKDAQYDAAKAQLQVVNNPRCPKKLETLTWIKNPQYSL